MWTTLARFRREGGRVGWTPGIFPQEVSEGYPGRRDSNTCEEGPQGGSLDHTQDFVDKTGQDCPGRVCRLLTAQGC